MKGLLNVQAFAFQSCGGLLALRETRYPITSFFTINEARVSKDGRWCVSFTDDDTRAPMFNNNVPLLENSCCFNTPNGIVAYICGESLRIICMPQNALTHHCFTTKLKLAITFYRRFWHIDTYIHTTILAIYTIFSLQTFHDLRVYCVLYCEMYIFYFM